MKNPEQMPVVEADKEKLKFPELSAGEKSQARLETELMVPKIEKFFNEHWGKEYRNLPVETAIEVLESMTEIKDGVDFYGTFKNKDGVEQQGRIIRTTEKVKKMAKELGIKDYQLLEKSVMSDPWWNSEDGHVFINLMYALGVNQEDKLDSMTYYRNGYAVQKAMEGNPKMKKYMELLIELAGIEDNFRISQIPHEIENVRADKYPVATSDKEKAKEYMIERLQDPKQGLYTQGKIMEKFILGKEIKL